MRKKAKKSDELRVYLSVSNRSDNLVVPILNDLFTKHNVIVERYDPAYPWTPDPIENSDVLVVLPNKNKPECQLLEYWIGKGQYTEIDAVPQGMPCFIFDTETKLFGLVDKVEKASGDSWIYFAKITRKVGLHRIIEVVTQATLYCNKKESRKVNAKKEIKAGPGLLAMIEPKPRKRRR